MRLLLLLAVAGCVADQPFECQTAADCRRGSEEGVCEPTGFCSFADSSCGDAERRYGDLAGLDLAGTCVPCVAEIAGGGRHLCARTQTGALHCWGENASGQVGDGSTTERLLPVELELDDRELPVPPIIDIGLGSNHSCATTVEGVLLCWGSNSSGQAGDLDVDTLRPAIAGGGVAVAGGLSHTCWLGGDGSMQCLGDNTSSQLGTDQDQLQQGGPVTTFVRGVASVALGAGAFHTCAVMDDASLRCWGGNTDGQIGNGSHENARAPVTVRPAGTTRAAAASDRFTCSVEQGGGVLCWGDNEYGQLGDGTLDDRDVPTAVLLPAEATQIALGDDHACARTRTGELWCWGSNAIGQLGPAAGAQESEPVRVRESGVVAAAAATNTTCFLEVSGALFCMGAGSSGERGDGGEEDGAEPVEVGLSCDTVP